MEKFLSKIKKFIPPFIFEFLSPTYHWIYSFLGALIYRFPSNHLILVGVTGTNGKTTVVHMLSSILSLTDKTAHISSVSFKINDQEETNYYKMTMPGRFFVQKFLRKAVDAGCKYAVIEVTSEGIKQFRSNFLNFDVAVFTNLSREHIERHGSFENYRLAKQKLFQQLILQPRKIIDGKKIYKTIVVNASDKNAENFTKYNADEVLGFASENIIVRNRIGKPIPLLIYQNVKSMGHGMSFSIENNVYFLPMFGEFNIQNAAAAITVSYALQIKNSLVKKALENFHGVSGRMEVVHQKPLVLIDYAHTPEALKNLYSAIKTGIYNQKPRKLVCVLGAAGGGRDKWKRPELGKIADKFCDNIFITNEDPYDEDPRKIMDDVASGVKNKKPHLILDRKIAIHKALASAQYDDAVVISGKGSEPWMMLADNKKIKWDDRKIARDEIEKLNKF
jgi:UDP-N-acetylmuramoyl-L-alanyl-D-glutamate--2,6-diaminopimelate ligase